MLHRICTEDASLAVEVVGDGDIAILFVHGLGSNRDCWHRAAEHFDLGRYRLILPDLPGFGDSEVSTDYDYSMRALGRGLRALIEPWDSAEWHVVAHSMGGAVALALFGESGWVPSSFVSAEGNLEAADAFMSRNVARRSEAAFIRIYPKWVKTLRASFGRQPTEQQVRYVQSLTATSPIAVYRAARECLLASCSGELAQCFAALSCPVAYVYGEHTRRLRGLPNVAQLPQVEHWEVPQQGHFMMESADTFYRWIGRWVECSSQYRH